MASMCHAPFHYPCTTASLSSTFAGLRSKPVGSSIVCFHNTGDGFASRNKEEAESLRLQLPSQRLQGLVRLFKSHGAIPHASSAGEHNNPLVLNSESEAFNLLQVVPAPLQTFPWAEARTRLAERVGDLLWNVGKWVVLPLLVVMTFAEVVFTISTGKELLIPIGLLAGTVLAGILKETAVILGNGFQDGAIPWHLLGIGALFAVFKIAGFMCNNWVCAPLLHFASGGLWQTIRFIVDWQRSRVRMPDAEENS